MAQIKKIKNTNMLSACYRIIFSSYVNPTNIDNQLENQVNYCNNEKELKILYL